MGIEVAAGRIDEKHRRRFDLHLGHGLPGVSISWLVVFGVQGSDCMVEGSGFEV